MIGILRLLDANLNRAREALRVLEDLARFDAGDARLSASLKAARHALDREARPHARALREARDAAGDVGRDRDVPVRGGRSAGEIAAANAKRAQEALRSVEEAAKGRFPSLAATAHRLRYAAYVVERELLDPRRRLASAKLYVLLDPSVAAGSLERIAAAAVRGGADVLQLRQKPRVDVGLARALKAAGRGALFLVNDDPGVALAAAADGVHLGLEDLPIAEAKRLGVGIVGATSHSLAEARRARRAGADYVSVGPMFATPLKPDLEPRGAGYLAAVKKLGIPHFCIGGITAENAKRSFTRVAVCSAVIGAKDPKAAARAIRRALT